MNNIKIPTASKFSVVRQFCNYIPNHLVPKLARETGVDEQARTSKASGLPGAARGRTDFGCAVRAEVSARP